MNAYARAMAFSFIIMASITVTAMARLGENEVACAIRYNHGIDIKQTNADRFSPLLSGANTTNRTYSFQGWKIRIGFMKGIAHRMRYQHENPNHRITEEEQMVILNANGGSANWRPEKIEAQRKDAFTRMLIPSYSGVTWVRNDGAKATRDIMGISLSIDSAAYLNWEARKKKTENKAIPNF